MPGPPPRPPKAQKKKEPAEAAEDLHAKIKRLEQERDELLKAANTIEDGVSKFS